jgi:hypothetical protein
MRFYERLGPHLLRSKRDRIYARQRNDAMGHNRTRLNAERFENSEEKDARCPATTNVNLTRRGLAEQGCEVKGSAGCESADQKRLHARLDHIGSGELSLHRTEEN